MSQKKHTILKVDIDERLDQWNWLTPVKRGIKAVLREFGYDVSRIKVKESSSGNGLHLYIHVFGDVLSDEKRNLLQL